MTLLQPYTVGRRPERIDRIAKRLYGSERRGAVERLWDANPGLAAFGAFVPPATVIQVPAPVATSVSIYQVPWA